MASPQEVVFTMKADTTRFSRDINRARRRMQFVRVYLPMLVGAAIAVISATVGFLLGAAS